MHIANIDRLHTFEFPDGTPVHVHLTRSSADWICHLCVVYGGKTVARLNTKSMPMAKHRCKRVVELLGEDLRHSTMDDEFARTIKYIVER